MRARGRAPFETPYRAICTIHFLGPDLGVAGHAGLPSRNSRTPACLGTKSNRPARNRLAEAARRSQFDLGLVLRLDRWGRSVTDCVDTWRPLTSYGVAWMATSQGLSTEEGSPMGRFMISVMSAFSEMERGMIVQRVVAGVKKAPAAGKHCGRPRRVFRRDEAARLREEGKSWAAIGRILGVPAGTVR